MLRRLAGNDPAVNEEWNCDKGRWAFPYATRGRPARPTRWSATTDGELRVGLLARGARGRGPRAGRRHGDGGVGVLTGGRLTVEDAYAYTKFARVALGTNDIDFRARPHSAEEAAFLAATSWPAPTAAA